MIRTSSPEWNPPGSFLSAPQSLFPVFSSEKDRYFPFREPRFIFAYSGLRMDPGLPGKLQITLFLRKTEGR